MSRREKSSFYESVRNMLQKFYSLCNFLYNKVKCELAITPAALYWIVKDRINRNCTKHLSEHELCNTRTSDTIFIFGSGSSLLDLTAKDWAHFEKHNTMGFNYFMMQKKMRVDYHLIREIGLDDINRAVWLPDIKKYMNLIIDNPFYNDTIILLQHGWKGVNGNRTIGMRLFPDKTRVFRYKNIYARHKIMPPSDSFSKGLVHGPGTLTDCVNFAYILGWKKIVLVGVDLYDNRYFWLDPDKTRRKEGSTYTSNDPYPTADLHVQQLGYWRACMAQTGAELYVSNPKSRLAEVLPVYSH